MDSTPKGSNKLNSMGHIPDGMRIGMWVAGVLFGIFGFLTIQFAFALFDGTVPWATTLTASILQYPETAEAGLLTLEESHARYREMLAVMPTHAVLGGVIVALGLLQFVPSLRRKHRQVHRTTGVVLAFFMLAVCVTALQFLFVTKPSEVFAGQAFWVVLFALAGLPLLFIPQAALAALSKDFRSHMVWMGLAFCCFLTAPILRYNYLIVGFFDPQSLNRIVLNSSPSVLIQGFLLFMIWFNLVGDKDLPFRADKQLWKIPANWLRYTVFTAIVSAVVVFGVVIVIFESSFFKVGSSTGISLLSLACGARVIQLLSSRDVWVNGYKGQKPTRAYIGSTLIASCAMLGLAFSMNTESFNAHSIFYALVNFAVIEVLTLALACLTGPLRNGAHLLAMASAALSWSWIGMPGMLAGIYLAGFEFGVALTCLALVPPTFMAFGIVVATGSGFFLGVQRPSAAST